MRFTEFNLLVDKEPTFPSEERCRELIDMLISINQIEKDDEFEFIDLLLDLIHRLHGIYAYLDEDQSLRILNWIETKWTEGDIKKVDYMISVVANLSEQIAKDFFKNKVQEVNNEKIRALLIEALSEFD